jgi:hypothetical protein
MKQTIYIAAQMRRSKDSPGAQIELDYAMHLGIDMYAEI